MPPPSSVEPLIAGAVAIGDAARDAIDSNAPKARAIALKGLQSIDAELRVVSRSSWTAAQLAVLRERVAESARALEAPLTDLVLSGVRLGFDAGQQVALTNFGLDIGMGWSAPGIPSGLLPALSNLSATKVKGLVADAIDLVDSWVARGLIGGAPIGEVLDGLSNVIDQPGPFGTIRNRAEVIYRTQGMQALSVAQRFATAPIVSRVPGTKKRWMATWDKRTRLWHVEANGQVVPYDEPFMVGGERMMHPHDPNGSARNCCNCRCTWVVVPDIDAIRAFWMSPLSLAA